MQIKQQSIAPLPSPRSSLLSGVAVVFAAAATPLPTAWGSLALALLLVAFLAQAYKSTVWSRIYNDRPSQAALLLLAALAVGMLYGKTNLHQAFEFWGKYLKLLALPLIIGLAPSQKWRNFALNSALAAISLSVLVSYMRYLGVIHPFIDPNQAYIGFQNRITFGLYTSIASYIFAYRAIKSKSANFRIYYIILFIFMAYNTLAINNGRTGYVILFSLTALFLFRHTKKSWRLPSLAAAIFVITVILLASPISRDRLERTITNAQTLQGKSPTEESSIVIRWQFLKNSLAIIESAPIVGHGTGSFESQYAYQIVGTNQVGSSNPHNDYLLIVAQLGIVGLLAEFFLIFALHRAAQDLAPDKKEWAYALLLAFVLYSALNSTLLNAGEGRFFLILFGIILLPAANQPHAEST